MPDQIKPPGAPPPSDVAKTAITTVESPLLSQIATSVVGLPGVAGASGATGTAAAGGSTAFAPQPFSVQGRVSLLDGSPLVGATVVAFDQDLRGAPQPLGPAGIALTTDGEGRYQISYTPDQFARAEKGSADLFVRVLSSTGTVLAQSETLFNAPAVAIVDHVVSTSHPDIPSEYDRLLAELDPLLINVDIPGTAAPTTLARLADLKAPDIDFLVGETGEPRAKLEAVVAAALLGQQAFAMHLNAPAPAWYGIARKGLSLNANALAARTDPDVTSALGQAISDNIIATVTSEQIREWVLGVRAIVGTNALDVTRLRSLLDSKDFTLAQLRTQDPALLDELVALSNSSIASIGAGSLIAGASPDQPITSIPGVVGLVSRAHVQQVATLAGLPAATAATIGQTVPALGAVNDAALTKLVAAQQLTDAQAHDLGFATAAYQLADQNVALAGIIRTARPTPPGITTPTSTRDLAKLTATDWINVLTTSGVALPEGTTAVTVGQALADRLAILHVGIALFGRMPTTDAASLTAAVTSLAPLLALNPKLVGVPFETLNTAGIDAAQITELQGTLSKLTELAQTYTGLQIATALEDPQTAPDAKATLVARRVGWVQQVVQRVGEDKLLHLDLATQGSGVAQLDLDQLNASPEEQVMVLSTLQGHQRLWSLTNNADRARALLAKGFTSASAIGRLNLDDFVERSGIDHAAANPIWEAARMTYAGSALAAYSAFDAINGGFQKFRVSNQLPSIEDYLAKMPGYQDLFGNLSFCSCDDCQSILGPAAHFVDLMSFIDENLRSVFVKNPKLPQVLDLKVRRSDLWSLELSCENTNTRVPTLDIVNEVLANYVGQSHPGQDAYQDVLTTAVDSFSQPFFLPLARIQAYLQALNIRRADIARALGSSTATQSQAELGLYKADLALVTAPDPDLGHMSHIYGIAFTGAPTAVDAVDAQDLVAAVGLTRAELTSLIAAQFVTAGGAIVKIAGAKRDKNSVQNDVEWTNGLTADALDRMHRLTRLARVISWAIGDLDLVITAVGSKTLDSAAIDAIAQLHAVQAQCGTSIPDLCALVGLIPQTPAGLSLFDQLFNAPVFVDRDGAYPKPKQRFIHPAFRQTTTAALPDPNIPRLLAGLSVDSAGLEVLVSQLAKHLEQESQGGFDPNAANEDDRYFVLSLPNLSLLYRHARVAKLLAISIDGLFQLLGFLGLEQITAAADLRSVLELGAWCQTSGYRLDDIAIATGQVPRDTTVYPDPAVTALNVATAAATTQTFSGNVFAASLGLTEQASLDVIASNSAVIEATSTGDYQLVSGIDLDVAVITVPPSAVVPVPLAAPRPAAASEVREVLRPYLASVSIARGLGSAFGFPIDKVLALVAMTGQTLTTDPLTQAARADAGASPAALLPLSTLIKTLSPLAVAFRQAAWDAATLAFVQGHHELFGTGALPQTTASSLHPNVPFLSLEQLQGLSVYGRIVGRTATATGGTPAVDPKELQSVLIAIGQPAGFPPPPDAALANVLGVPVGQIAGLRGNVTLPSLATAALDQLNKAAQLTLQLGVDGKTLVGLLSDDYTAASNAANALVSSIAARYTDPVARSAKLDTAEQTVREAKRDALVSYLLHSQTPKAWSTVNDLYDYFLIDVEVGGCSTTSRIVSATMTAQLYVQRVIMNLEHDGNLPPTVSVSMPADVAAEWEWRQNYRVWQANREVFLWSENYHDPNLRDDKTPLFQELEQELLQTGLTEQNVLDAYNKYLAGFDEVASLTIAGAYQQVNGDDDILHLFGATSSDPPIYYYRTCRGLIASRKDNKRSPVWSAWQKINVQISGRKVSPVVYTGRLYVFWVKMELPPAGPDPFMMPVADS